MSNKVMGTKQRIIFSLVTAVVVMAIYVMIKFGWFIKIEISDATVKPIRALVATHIGHYKEVSAVMGELYKDAYDNNIKNKSGIVMYLDSPNGDTTKLRAIVGELLYDKDSVIADTLKRKYKEFSTPQLKVKVANFPYRGQISIMFAMMKIYPKFRKNYPELMGNPIIEVYDIDNGMLSFMLSESHSGDDLWGLVNSSTPSTQQKIENDKIVVDTAGQNIVGK